MNAASSAANSSDTLMVTRSMGCAPRTQLLYDLFSEISYLAVVRQGRRVLVARNRFLAAAPRHQIVEISRDAREPTGSARLRPVVEHLDLLDRDQSTRHHGVEERQECIDLLLGIDDLDHDRQILRQAQDLGGVNAARMAEADSPAQNRRPAQLHLPGLQHDRLVERQAFELVVLAEKYPQQNGVTRDLHVRPTSSSLSTRQGAHRSTRRSGTAIPKTRYCRRRAPIRHRSPS